VYVSQIKIKIKPEFRIRKEGRRGRVGWRRLTLFFVV
jgi:hypothetical protein